MCIIFLINQIIQPIILIATFNTAIFLEKINLKYVRIITTSKINSYFALPWKMVWDEPVTLYA